MRGAYQIISIRGIKIHIHWTFLLLFGWVLLVNANAGNNVEQMSWSILFLLAVFACITLHELGHALMAARFGIKAKEIILLPIGGIASIEKFPENSGQELAISITGPLVNLAIAGILWLFIPNLSLVEYDQHISIMHGHDFLYNLRIINIALAVFNLIPAFPMDGGRILRALLGSNSRENHSYPVYHSGNSVDQSLFSCHWHIHHFLGRGRRILSAIEVACKRNKTQ